LAQSRTPQGLDEELIPPIPRVNAPAQSFFEWRFVALGLLLPGIGLFLRGRRWDGLAVFVGTAWATGMSALVGARLVRAAAMAEGLEPSLWSASSLWTDGLVASVTESSALPWPLLAMLIHVGTALVSAVRTT